MSSDCEDDWDEDAEAQLVVIESSLSISTVTPITRPPPVHLEITVDDNSINAIASTSKLTEITESTLSTPLVQVVDDVVIAEVPDTRSLWERFRKRRGGNFSVSDLVGPSWCEVQHTYRLSSKAYLRPEARPTSITSKSGSTVPIDLSRTISREQILDKGKAIHKVIEDEVMGVMEEVKVVIESEEDRWSLRILNMCVGLETLLATGRTRELSVHGFVGDDLLVYGIIDEIYRQDMTPTPSSSTASTSTIPTSTSKKIPEDDTTQKKLETFFTPIPSPKKSTEKGKERAVEEPSKDFKRLAYIISDTKTRNTPTVPRRGDSKSARLQLMLYHQLLTSLLITPPKSSFLLPSSQSLPQPFSWTTLYSKLSLDPNLPLSPTYLTSILPVIIGSSLELSIGLASTLGQYVEVLQSYGKRLSGNEKGPFENRLEISYRLRNNVSRFNWKERSKLNQKLPEDEELAKAIAESLRNVDSRPSGAVVDGGNDEDEEQLALAIALSLSGLDVDLVSPSQQDATMNAIVLEEDSNSISILADSTSLLDATSQIDRSLPFSPLLTNFDLDLEENSQVETISRPVLALKKRRQSSPSEIQIEILERTRKRSKNLDIDPSKSDRALQLTLPISTITPSSEIVIPVIPDTSNIEILEEGSLIGVEKFAFNSQLLKTHLDDMIQYWMGFREARGVEIEQTYRCRTCEFESGCEWREAKANLKQHSNKEIIN